MDRRGSFQLAPGTVEKGFRNNRSTYGRSFAQFVRSTRTGIEATLFDLWEKLRDLHVPFLLDVDADMARLTFSNGRSTHMCTSTRRFHRPKKTGKPTSVTIFVSGFRREYDDPERHLIPCDTSGKIDCCYFGIGEEEADLAMFYITQLIRLRPRPAAHRPPKAIVMSRKSL